MGTADDWGNRLYELFDDIIIVVKVVFVVREHGWAILLTRHEVVGEKELVAMRLFDVIIFNREPAFVWNDGVTVNESKLSLVCIHDILLAYPCVPVNAEMYVYGMAAEFDVTDPNIIGLLRLASVSMLTVIVNIGLEGISTLNVTVMIEFWGIVGKPVILTPLLL